MIRDIKRNFINDGMQEYPDLHQRKCKLMKTPVVGKVGLVTSIDSLSSLVAEKLVTSLEDCLKPYMPYYLAMELIDPTAPRGNPVATL